jgi:hypothetical protein
LEVGRSASAATRIIGLASVLALLILPGIARADREHGRVVTIIAGGISIRDLADPRLRNVNRMFAQASAGLMNVKTGKPTKDIEPAPQPGMLSGCLTLGAGTMASGGMEVSRAYDASIPIGGITAGDLYASRTGAEWSPENVLHTEIVKMLRINEVAAYRAKPGALGSVLHKAGIRTAVIGASDTCDEIHHEAVAAAMDESGLVDYGTVCSPLLTVPDPASPFGMKTNVDFVAGQVRSALRQCGFVVVDFGDTLRADWYCNFCTDEQAATIRSRAARGLDDLIGRIRKCLNPRRDLLIVLSPCARSFSEIEDERLAPVLISGGSFERGMLTSPSTRRPGVVTLCDVAATVCSFFGLEPAAGMAGRPMNSVPSQGTRATLVKLNLDAANHAQRQPAMRGGSVFQSVIVVMATIALLLGSNERLRRTAKWMAVLPAIVPLAMLYLSILYKGGLVGSVAVLAGMVLVALALCIVLFRSPARSLAWMCGLLVLSLLVDLALGSPLAKWSIAGYSLIEGARYYGLGNELAGTLLGAALVCLGLAFAGNGVPARARGIVALLVFGLLFVSVSSPGMGADAGGAISVAVGFLTAMLARSGWRPSLRGLAVTGGLVAAAVIAMLLLDSHQSGSAQSHIGRAIQMMESGDSGGILAICVRKLELNAMLISTSMWSRLLLLSLVGAVTLIWTGRGFPLACREIRGTVAGLAAGTTAAFVFNDSGVVAAAASAVLLWSMLAVLFDKDAESKSRPEGDSLALRSAN